MKDFYAERIKEENEDLKTLGDKGVNVKMTDKQYSMLTLHALKVGFNNASELLGSFTADLTDHHSNGSDERMYAEQWFDRAFGIWEETRYFFRYYLYDNEIEAEDFDLENDIDYFEEVYSEYLEEADNKDHESKEECLTIIKEMIKEL
jgi:hypothetical protein